MRSTGAERLGTSAPGTRETQPRGCAPSGAPSPVCTQSRSRSGAAGGGSVGGGLAARSSGRAVRGGAREGAGEGAGTGPPRSALGWALGAGRRPDGAAGPSVGLRVVRGRAATPRGSGPAGRHSPLRGAGAARLFSAPRGSRSSPRSDRDAPRLPQRLSYPVCLSVRPARGAARTRRRPGCGSCRRCQDAVTMGTERRGARRSRIYR